MTVSILWKDAVPSANLTSALINARNFTNANIQIQWDTLDAADGVFTVEGTNFDPTGTDWETVATKTAATTPSSWEISFVSNAFNAKYYRIRFTKNTVTNGVINAIGVFKNN